GDRPRPGRGAVPDPVAVRPHDRSIPLGVLAPRLSAHRADRGPGVAGRPPAPTPAVPPAGGGAVADRLHLPGCGPGSAIAPRGRAPAGLPPARRGLRPGRRVLAVLGRVPAR